MAFTLPRKHHYVDTCTVRNKTEATLGTTVTRGNAKVRLHTTEAIDTQKRWHEIKQKLSFNQGSSHFV